MSAELTAFKERLRTETLEKFIYKEVTIASSGTTSTEADLFGLSLVGFYMPASFTGTSISFTVSPESGGTFYTVGDGAGNSYSKTVSANKFIPINPADTAGWQHVKLVSGSSQGAERTIKLVARPIA